LRLERVTGVQLSQVGELRAWERVAGWLGRAHAALARRMGSAALPHHDRDYYRRWLTRARRFASGVDGAVAPYGAAVERLLALPRTVIHGELYAPNVLVSESPTSSSKGTAVVTAGPRGTPSIEGSIAVFTELSTDGGASWVPAAGGATSFVLEPES
jgi:hypothetical protein